MVVDALDVVTRLDDHQQNVPAPRRADRARVVCLPPPPIERALGLGARLDDHRRGLCEALAARVGGGDGAATVERLGGAGAIPRALDAWRREGVASVHVVGARAQPGWARALLARWGGGLRFEGSVDDALDRALRRELDRAGVEVTAAEPAAERSYAADDAGVGGVWRGFVPGDARFAARRALRDAWVRRWEARGEGAAVRAALVGDDPALEEALRVPWEAAGPAGPVAVAITGVDGAGKSTQVAALAASLAARGLRVRVIKLYRQGPFLALANELSGRTRGGAALDLFRTSRVVKLVDSLRVWRDEVLPAAAGCDVLVFDRYLETHEAAAGSQLAWDLAAHPALAVFPRVDAEFLLRLDAEVALARVGGRGEGRSADEHPTGLRGYAACFDRIAERDGFVVLDARADREETARAILARTEAIVASRARVEAGGAPPEAPPAPRVGGEGLVLGGDAPWGAPGDDVCALAEFVRGARPEVAAGFPEAFWLEAYAAQVLLDLRIAGGRGAEVACWPVALTRAAEFADLVALAELERMTLHRATVRAVRLDGDGAARRLRALVGDGAGRLASLHREALGAHARERAWPLVP